MTLDFQQLVLNLKGDSSYTALSRAAGGTPDARAIQSITQNGFTRFPSPETIAGLAKALHTTQRELVLAAARTIGIPVDDEDEHPAIQRPGTPEPEEQIYYWRKHAEHYKARAQREGVTGHGGGHAYARR